MQFQHPEFLYALFALLIPVIVHLFHLRRFKTQAFTNVKFLKKIQLQTRKSSRLKKWLTLLARLLALAALIIAFAQPFIPHSKQVKSTQKTVVYIDNSFSMQRKTENRTLLSQAVQQLLQALPADKKITVLTNDQVFDEAAVGQLKNKLLNIDFSSSAVEYKTLALRAKTIFDSSPAAGHHVVAISDFQAKNGRNFPQFDSTVTVDFIQLRGENRLNYSIDSVYLSTEEASDAALVVRVSASEKTESTLPISLYHQDTLKAKSSLGFDNDTVAVARFSLRDFKQITTGRLEIADRSLQFDNTFYFSTQDTPPITVVAINSGERTGDFLKKIVDSPAFHYTAISADALEYGVLEKANLIVLNELQHIPDGLENILQVHLDKGGYLCVIPSIKRDRASYNTLLGNLGLGELGNINTNTLKVTTINFDHPLFNGVFTSEVTNFQYPEVARSYQLKNQGVAVLSYNDGRNFLASNHHCYLFSAPINTGNSNFQQSPLIVPVFYNMAKQSLPLPQLYYTLGERHKVAVLTTLNHEEVLRLERGEQRFIPRQQRFNEKVVLDLQQYPRQAGTYAVTKQGQPIDRVSFNYNRAENATAVVDLTTYEAAQISHNVDDFFAEAINKNEVDPLWNWFVIFAIVFLLVEVAFLKYLK